MSQIAGAKKHSGVAPVAICCGFTYWETNAVKVLVSGVLCVGVIFLLGTIGCGATQAQLKTRAAFDMQCSEEQVELVEIDSRTYGVRGCGKQATYVETCAHANDTDCTWLLNTDSHEKQAKED
jgi:hypothetical protein